MTVFALNVEGDDDPSEPTESAFPAFLSCKGCGQLLGDTPLGAGLDLGKEKLCLKMQLMFDEPNIILKAFYRC